MLNELPWSRAMPIGLSCLLHVGLVTGLILAQSWVTSVVALPPPVLPVQLVTLDAVEPPRDAAPPAPPRRRRGKHRRGAVSRRRAGDGHDGQRQHERQGYETNRQHTRQGNHSTRRRQGRFRA